MKPNFDGYSFVAIRNLIDAANASIEKLERELKTPLPKDTNHHEYFEAQNNDRAKAIVELKEIVGFASKAMWKTLTAMGGKVIGV